MVVGDKVRRVEGKIRLTTLESTKSRETFLLRKCQGGGELWEMEKGQHVRNDLSREVSIN